MREALSSEALDPVADMDPAEERLIAAARVAVCGGAAKVARDSHTHGARPAIAGYELIREIGRGGQGVVYQARQRSTGRDVAIKMLRQGMLATGGEQARLEREVRILAQLRHPGIVAIHDSGTAAGLSYVVMDYIDGSALDAHLAETRATLRERVELFARVADAVHAAHVRGVIHRDLKPANVRVDADGGPHVLDFGVAKLLETDTPLASLTLTGQFLGSLQWAAPEQARGDQSAVDVRTDVYALGVIFWQAIIGDFPYPVDGDVSRVMAMIKSVEPSATRRARSRVPFDVETILRRCLQKDPARRYQSAAELADDLRRFLDGRAIAARRDSQWYVLRKTIARHRLVFGLVAAMLVVATGSAIGFAWMYRVSEVARQDVERANRELRRDLFAATPSLTDTVLDFDDGRMDERFVATGAVRVDGGRLIAECTTQNEAAWTLIPSRSVLRGDFDITIDFALESDAPLVSGATQCVIHLVNVRMGHYESWVARYREKDPKCPDVPEDAYIAGGGGNCPPGRAGASGNEGRLRITRQGSMSTSYYWDGAWKELHRQPIPDDVLGFEVVVRRILSDAPLRYSFDRLTVRTAFPHRALCLEEYLDDFSGSVVDPRFRLEESFGSPSEDAGRLNLVKLDGYSGFVRGTLDSSRFLVCGDFDLSAEYWLSEWPELQTGERTAGLALLNAADHRPVAIVERVRDAGGHNGTIRDFIRVRASERETTATNTDPQGGLLLSRRSDQLTISARDSEDWRDIFVGAITSGDLSFQYFHGGTDLAHRSAVQFDNLRLTPR